MRLFVLSCILILGSVVASKRNYDTHNFYVIEHDARYAALASVSAALGIEVVERAGELPNHWLVRAPISGELASRSEQRDPVLDALARLRARSHLAARGDQEARAGAAVKYISRQTLRQRVKRAPIPQEPAEDARAVAQRLGITDPLFDKQWHLLNEEAPEHSMNVIPIWEMGYTGTGVITSFVDDGLDYTAEDLADNFAAEFSYDFNDHESLPTPKLPEDTHGTRCAGQVAAGKNHACGLGIAYNSKVAGVRILSGQISDVDEASALNYGFQNVSIYSCSWGPPGTAAVFFPLYNEDFSDNGAVMEGPDYLIDKAVINGINVGRGGKGSVFVFASGNGAASGDQCNFDGYTNSIYSVTVSAVDHKGLRPYYSEACTANMIAAYSSGSGKAITTTDKGSNKCASSHGGTSAAAPNAAGVFALALEARPDLTWRDIQHLCVQNARVISPDDDGWDTVADNRRFNSKFGYGTIDGLRYVQAALDWKLVKPQARMQTRTIQIEDGMMNPMGSYSGGQFIKAGGVTSSLRVKWDMLQDANFEKLEHIVIRVWIDHTRRGDVQVELTSPGGITSVLAEPRRADNANTGFPGWDFMTVKHWGEDMIGDWTLKVSDQASAAHNGSFLGWNMVFWGSVIDASKAVLYDVSPEDPVLPPHEDPQPLPPATATNTKTYTKPTIFLTSEESTSTLAAAPEPTDHEDAEIAEPAASSHDDPDHEVADALHSEQRKVVAGIVFIVALISSVGGIFIWRKRSNKSAYITLQEEQRAIPMSGTGRSALAADGNDSDEEADERTGLRSGSYQHQGFHSGFLEDDDDEEGHEYPPSRSPGRVSPAYRDEAERPTET